MTDLPARRTHSASVGKRGDAASRSACGKPRAVQISRATFLALILVAMVVAGVLVALWVERPARAAADAVYSLSLLIVPLDVSGPGAAALEEGILAQLIADLMRF